MITDERKALIEKQALSLIDAADTRKPPVNAEYIAEKIVGVDVVFGEFQDGGSNMFHGFFDMRDNSIVVNKDDSPSEKLFTIAHELGHKVLHEEYLGSKDYIPRMKSDHAEVNTEEEEADYFACHLLAPDFMVNKYKKMATVKELEEIFIANPDVREKVLGTGKWATTK